MTTIYLIPAKVWNARMGTLAGIFSKTRPENNKHSYSINFNAILISHPQTQTFRRGQKLIDLGSTIFPNTRPTSAAFFPHQLPLKPTTEKTTTTTTPITTTIHSFWADWAPIKHTTEESASLKEMLAILQISEHDDSNREVSERNATDIIIDNAMPKGNNSVLDFNFVVGDGGGGGDGSFLDVNNNERY